MEAELKEVDMKKKINEEGKNFVNRIIEESKAALLGPKTEAKKHH
jgi:hypothetical protein